MARTSPFTWLGLLLTYVSVTLTRYVFTQIYGDPLPEIPFIFRELLNLGTVALLFWLILKKEKLSLASIGITSRPWKETTIWSVAFFL